MFIGGWLKTGMRAVAVWAAMTPRRGGAARDDEGRSWVPASAPYFVRAEEPPHYSFLPLEEIKRPTVLLLFARSLDSVFDRTHQ